MQEKHLYEYAIIRVLPKVEREEFINVGIILFCKQAKYIRMIYEINEPKLSFFSKEADIDLIKENLSAFEEIVKGSEKGGKMAQLDIAERFRWLTAVRSTLIQTSRPHSGFSDNLDKTAEALFNELVI